MYSPKRGRASGIGVKEWCRGHCTLDVLASYAMVMNSLSVGAAISRCVHSSSGNGVSPTASL
eukprot:scaffold18065_cov111-Isochrysis_galbana.AAC.4